LNCGGKFVLSRDERIAENASRPGDLERAEREESLYPKMPSTLKRIREMVRR
jgi:hypothetical protein